MAIVCVVLAGAAVTSMAADNWTRFRGENGTGLSNLKGVPVTWTDSDYAWTVEFENVGHSAPIIWEKSLFVTTSTEGGGKRFLHCLNADTGRENWVQSMTFNESPKHLKNSWASSTPATDGKYVYTIFADLESHVVSAWDFTGKQVWTRNLGAFDKDHGQGVSPVVAGDLLIVPNDQKGPSSMVALDKNNGEIVWSVERPSGQTSFSTPMLIPGDGGSAQLICLSESSGMTSFDVLTGKVNWQTVAMPLRTVASPVESKGLIIATCGKAGSGQYLMAVNAAEGIPAESRLAFERKVMLPYVPTPIAYNDLLLMWGDSGIMVCLEMPSGRELWKERLAGAAFSGSPICIDGNMYCMTEGGEAIVVKASREFELLGRVPLGQSSHSTPAVANDHLYLRTYNKLMALKAKPQ